METETPDQKISGFYSAKMNEQFMSGACELVVSLVHAWQRIIEIKCLTNESKLLPISLYTFVNRQQEPSSVIRLLFLRLLF
mmetsp:Transcript_3316/g.6557  ORF Transcript_3316/g.6557 Transcript_3316/m.6557 type:complete len:81 (+) Transcript_3316:935-1177(+)